MADQLQIRDELHDRCEKLQAAHAHAVQIIESNIGRVIGNVSL